MRLAGVCASLGDARVGVELVVGEAVGWGSFAVGVLDEAGVRAWGATSPLGSQSGREGVAGRPDGKCVGSGLTTRGATSPLDGATVEGVVGTGVYGWGATSSFGGVTAGLGSAQCFNAVT